MGEEFKDFEAEAPVLTLEPDLTDEKDEVTAKEPEKTEEPAIEEPVLSPQEQKMVDDFAAKIDIENTNQILQFGAGTQKKMADFSDAALENVRTQDLGEVGDLLANVVGKLKDFDAAEEKGLFGFFKKQTARVDTLKNRYTKAEGNVAKITETLEQHQMRLMKDSAVLDKMYDQNLALTGGAPGTQTAMLAMDICNTYYNRIGFAGIGQAKAVVFTVLVFAIAMVQLRATRSKEVE